MSHVRHAAVAGMFYPESAGALSAAVRGHLATAAATAAATGAAGADTPAPKAIIAPHAGYIYSGAIAAQAYARFVPIAARVRRVVLLGPCHRVAVRGLAVSSSDAFETPLGRLAVDAAARTAILALPQVKVFDATHAEEHSLEVQLPFMQEVFGDVAIVPLVVGEATADEVAEVIDRLWDGDETVFVISSDLSHFLDDQRARALDARTCAAIERLDPDAIGTDQACGRVPITGMLTVARRRGLRVTTLDLGNSGDTAGDRRRVVGYGAWMFTEPATRPRPGTAEGEVQRETERDGGVAAATQTLLNRHGAALLHLAAASIRSGLERGRGLACDPGEHPADLRGEGASFVTLHREGRLRGCIGSPTARQSLVQDVAANAYAAAFADRRFPPLTADETADLALSVSVLSPPDELVFATERELLALLRPGHDGLIIDGGGRGALFLPQVWASLPDPAAFLGHLKQKAGLDAGTWTGDLRAWRFHSVAVTSTDLADPAALWR